jgi:membrane-associated protease RseP (regulator of RpoE activity)
MFWKKWGLFALSACLALAIPLAAQAQATFQIRLAEEKAKEGDNAAELPSYWIGVALRDADPALLAHLRLEFGVLVGEVIADSPAAKAGLKPLDIITHAGETPIKTGEDLLKAVGEAKDKELTLTIYREAKKESIKVTPARRPEDHVAPQPPRAVEGQPHEAVERALRLWKQKAGPLEFDLLGPGVVVRAEPAPIPDDMKITVERDGPTKAKITVKQGENSWGANEKEIDTLPEVARPHVRMMLGLPMDHVFAFDEKVKLPKVEPPVAQPRFQRQGLRIELEDPLKRIEAELKRLRQDVEELRKHSEDK